MIRSPRNSARNDATRSPPCRCATARCVWANDRAIGLDQPSRAEIVAGMLSFFGAASGGTTKDALEKVRAMAKGRVRYCRPSDPPIHLTDPDARLYVLGPTPR